MGGAALDHVRSAIVGRTLSYTVRWAFFTSLSPSIAGLLWEGKPGICWRHVLPGLPPSRRGRLSTSWPGEFAAVCVHPPALAEQTWVGGGSCGVL